jgi:hypothetical protein
MMTTIEMVLETSVYLPFYHLTRLLARECFTEFTRRRSFILCTVYIVKRVQIVQFR